MSGTQVIDDDGTAAYRLPQGAIEKLGEWLVRRGLIARAELFTALDAAFRHGCRVGDALVWLEWGDERDRRMALLEPHHGAC